MTGAPICDQFCAAGNFLATAGGASAAACARCPDGSFSKVEGASACEPCPAGTASVANGTACAPLACASPLAFSADRSVCVGCAANTSGAYPACAPCARDSVCPGGTAVPLAGATALAAAAAAAATASCALLTGAGSLAPVLAGRSLGPGLAWLTGVLSVDKTLLSGLACAALAALLFAIGRVSPVVAPTVDALLVRFDAFAQSVPRQLDRPLDRKARPIGGTFSLLGGIAFVTLALSLVLARAADNVNAQRSVVVLDAGAAAAAAALPVFSAAPWGSGLQVRITASGNDGACASGATWAATDAGWTVARTPSCGGAAVSQLVFACADCVLTPMSSLRITLPYSCQSLRVEAAAMDGAGVVAAFALPVAETTAALGTLLATISWTLPTLLSVVNSSVSPSARGYTLASSTHVVTTTALAAAAGGGLVVSPSDAAVVISISLPLNLFYATTVLTEKQSIAALLASIVGLAGVFSLFGSLLSATDVVAEMARTRAADDTGRARKARAIVYSEPQANGDTGTVALTGNPLILRAADGVDGSDGPNGADGAGGVDGSDGVGVDGAEWRVVHDGADVWFEAVLTGKPSWRLPIGAILVE